MWAPYITTPPNAPVSRASEISTEPAVGHHNKKKGLRPVRLYLEVFLASFPRAEESYRGSQTLSRCLKKLDGSKDQEDAASTNPEYFKGTGFRIYASPADNPNTSGSSTIVCPMADLVPDRVPRLVARRVEAKRRGQGLSTPEMLTNTTVARNSGEIKGYSNRRLVEPVEYRDICSPYAQLYTIRL